MKRIVALLLAVLLLAVMPAYADEKMNIVCTSFPCYDFARAVCGEKADISMLIKPGSEVHSFEPAPSDVLAIAQADLFVYIGGESDAWVEDILDSFGSEAPKALRFFDHINTVEAGHEHTEGHDHDHKYDEHIWTSQTNAIAMVNALCDAMCAADAANAGFYRSNAQAYTDEIAGIRAEITEILNGASGNELVFADRFPFLYFAEEYGLRYTAAFASCAAESEPSAKTIAMLIDKIISEEIPVIYILELSNGKIAKTIAEETGAEIRVFHSIQNVSEEEFAGGETYVSLMKKNTEALREGVA